MCTRWINGGAREKLPEIKKNQQEDQIVHVQKQKNKCDWKIFSVNNSKEETEQTSRMRKKEKGREKKRHGEEMKT